MLTKCSFLRLENMIEGFDFLEMTYQIFNSRIIVNQLLYFAIYRRKTDWRGFILAIQISIIWKYNTKDIWGPNRATRVSRTLRKFLTRELKLVNSIGTKLHIKDIDIQKEAGSLINMVFIFLWFWYIYTFCVRLSKPMNWALVVFILFY